MKISWEKRSFLAKFVSTKKFTWIANWPFSILESKMFISRDKDVDLTEEELDSFVSLPHELCTVFDKNSGNSMIPLSDKVSYQHLKTFDSATIDFSLIEV